MQTNINSMILHAHFALLLLDLFKKIYFYYLPLKSLSHLCVASCLLVFFKIDIILLSFSVISSIFLFCFSQISSIFLFCSLIFSTFLFCFSQISSIFLFCFSLISSIFVFSFSQISSIFLFCSLIFSIFLFCFSLISSIFLSMFVFSLVFIVSWATSIFFPTELKKAIN